MNIKKVVTIIYCSKVFVFLVNPNLEKSPMCTM